MKALRFYVLSLAICIGLTAFSRPGSYYPPPSNVVYHNDTLTIFPPDSLPGEPVILVGYNIYVDSVFFDNVVVSDPAESVDYAFTFPALPPGDHEFCAKAVYNEWISDRSCDSARVVYGYDMPFLEDWSTGSFEELQWLPGSGNWVIADGEGNPAPSAEFRSEPVQTNYSMSLESYPIDASGMTQGKIWLDFHLKLDCNNATGDELLRIEVWNWTQNVWTHVAEYYNDEGSFGWSSEHINIKALAMNKVFKVRFVAMGLNSGDIVGWFVDNIHIDRRCDGATDLVMEKHMDYNELLWVSPYGPCWDPWIHWDDGVNSGNSIGTGGAVEFDVAARWTPEQLVPYGGTSITMVSFFPAEEAATYNVRIWTGNGPDTMIVDQPVTNPVIGQWNYVTLTPPVPLDITKELWVGYYVNTTTGYPAGVDYGPAKDGYGNMMNYGGWQTLLQINPDLDFNWNIQCLIGTYPPDPNAPGIYFNIYRKTLNGTYQFLDTANQTDYKDYDLVVPEYYCYKVTMIWTKNNDTCESGATNEVCDVIYVVNPELQPGNTIKIFPNPAKDRLNIEADEEIREIRVYDLLGDEVWKIEIGNSDYKMDVSRLQSGIYYVTVTTAKKQFREKIVVMK